MQPASELFVIMIVLFVAGICILFASYMSDKILLPIKNRFTGTSAQGVIGQIQYAMTLFDQIFFFVTIGLGLVAVLLAYLTPARPAFLFLAIILFAISLLIVPQFANIWQDISEKTQFAAYTSGCSENSLGDPATCKYPMMWNIFKKYGLFFWGFGFLILIVLFSKIQGAGSV